jgi:hypothetical protein
VTSGAPSSPDAAALHIETGLPITGELTLIVSQIIDDQGLADANNWTASSVSRSISR